MIRCIRRPALAGSILCALAVLHLHAQQRPIDAFFEDFTAEWVRLSPNQATAARYFTGAEQDNAASWSPAVSMTRRRKA